ncbi:hypothetical protein AC26_4393 [Escherichia coli 1-176-05_S3_C2]|uniref:DUF6414 family protein n=1 Tax=Escherichia TaxID=561 RepID=UPI000451B851|nr:hypothetical protein AC26_4393 [Escherichia coli 1-176-05_S3_C2]WGM54090.1 hypothetical protein OSH18_08220 [Escherichia ruysiae]
MQLKNIIYIDYEKVYSLSSQLFEGVIQSAMEHKESTLSNIDAVEIKTKSSSSKTSDTKKISTVLNPHDYHYLKFENELSKRGILSNITSPIDSNKIKANCFVKITCPIQFNDYNKLKNTAKNFCKTNYAINFVHRNDELESLESMLKSIKPKSNEFNIIKARQAEIKSELDNLTSPNQKKFFEHLSSVLDYAYGDEIEISQKMQDIKFTSFLIRDFLKISPEMFVKLYSRRTTSAFTVVGIITRTSTSEGNQESEARELNGIRSAVWNMNDSLFDLESTFCAPDSDEYFIEPIAVYNEL